ncbi:MarR family winged helix-turn-helix transcriptional regulator [Sorangium sp. So ce131]|uniref:MarR family winged helix-turn-helix transcriptional regulator n=1 Tax=Sorangium sp. So ce131 TaxID=3133282 RepID=UPI003F6086AC
MEHYVTYAVIRAAKAHLRVMGARLLEHGLQPGQDMLLRQLWQGDGQSQSELIERLGVEPPTITKALGRLEKAGLVVRRRDPSDARVSRVYLTPRGKRLREPVTAIWAELEARAVAGLSAEDQRALTELARKMRANLERSG